MSRKKHDHVFRASLSKPQVAEAVLRTALPSKLVKRIDFTTLKPESGTFVDD